MENAYMFMFDMTTPSRPSRPIRQQATYSDDKSNQCGKCEINLSLNQLSCSNLNANRALKRQNLSANILVEKFPRQKPQGAAVGICIRTARTVSRTLLLKDDACDKPTGGPRLQSGGTIKISLPVRLS